jgi:nucleoside-diphosphate-sugar epimerase
MFRRVLAPDLYAAPTQAMLSHINVGTGKDISIRELANLVAEVTGFRGVVRCDTTKPDGTPGQRLGWRAGIELRTGIHETYRWYLEHESSMRIRPGIEE